MALVWEQPAPAVIGDRAVNSGEISYTDISYGYRLASRPAERYITLGATTPAGCPGSALDPQASPGFLCVYEGANGNVSGDRGVTNISWSTDPRSGADVWTASAAAGTYFAFTAWAVTSL